MRKRSIMKKIFVLLLAVSLSVGMAAPSMTVSAASSKTVRKKLDKKANKVLKTVVKKSDSKKKKLKKVFQYAEENWDYTRTMNFQCTDDWYVSYAYQTLKSKKGSCYGFAAAYGYLARKATGCKVRVAVGKTNGFSGELQDHAWTEVRIGRTWYICDVNQDKFAADSSMKFYLKKRNSAQMKNTYNKYKDVKYVTVK